MQNDTVDETALRTALAEFTGIWDALLPKERARVLRLLIAKVRFTGSTGELTIEFRDHGVEALARDTANRRSA